MPGSSATRHTYRPVCLHPCPCTHFKDADQYQRSIVVVMLFFLFFFLFFFIQFKDADQYQRSMRMPIGADWNTAITHNKAIQSKVCARVCVCREAASMWLCIEV